MSPPPLPLSGETGWLARLGSKEKYCLGRYGMDVEQLERPGVTAVREALAGRGETPS